MKARLVASVFIIAILGISSCRIDSNRNQSSLDSADVQVNEAPPNNSVQVNEAPPKNFVIANRFLQVFFSFNRDSLHALLSYAKSSQEEIFYHQKWSECAHYKFISMSHKYYEINDSTMVLPITLKNDLTDAFGEHDQVIDTFKLTIQNGVIISAKISSREPPRFDWAKEWVKKHRSGLVEKVCDASWANGSTPCECVLGLIQGFTEFKIAMDPYRQNHVNFFHDSNMNVEIDTIRAVEFDKTKMVVYRNRKLNGDSLVKVFAAQYKEVITLTDSCLVLKGKDKELRLCKNKSGDEKGWSGYEGLGYDHGYLLIEQFGYESWACYSFDPITRQYAITEGRPGFISNNLIYCVSNYYSDGTVQIVDTKGNRMFGFFLDNWEATAYYQQGNSIFIEYGQLGINESKLYLRVSF